MKTNDVEVLWVARYDYPPGWKMNIPHEHDYYQIIYFFDGKGDFYLEPEHYPAVPETFFFIKPFRVHQLFCDSKIGLKTFDIKFLVHRKTLREQLENVGPSKDSSGLEIQALFKKIREEGRDKKVYYKDFSDLYLQQMLFSIARFNQIEVENDEELADHISTTDGDDSCSRAVDYIKKHYGDEISLKSISLGIGYNQSYICQIFKRRLNTTPMAYLYHYRLKKAKELIMFSDYSLKQIATLTGFKNVHHFTRIFHEYEGKTPGQWRKTEKDGISKGVFLNAQFTNKNFLKGQKK